MVRNSEIEVKQLGYHFGKRDLDRVGYFDDTTAGHFGEYKNDSNIYRTKGKQFITGQPGDYFDKKFKRLFEGENSKELRADKIKEKPVGRYIVPTSPTKFHSTPNDWFGCIGKPIPYLSPAQKIDKKKKSIQRLPNFKIKPSPLGGPGYVNICLNPYPEYFSGVKNDGVKNKKKGEKPGKFLSAIKGPDYFLLNPYLELEPGPTYVNSKNEKFKTIGGKTFYVSFPRDAGCFSKFPEYLNENDRREEKKQNKHASVSKFILGGFNPKSKYTFSVIDRVTQVSCNANNFLQYQQRVYPL